MTQKTNIIQHGSERWEDWHSEEQLKQWDEQERKPMEKIKTK